MIRKDGEDTVALCASQWLSKEQVGLDLQVGMGEKLGASPVICNMYCQHFQRKTRVLVVGLL